MVFKQISNLFYDQKTKQKTYNSELNLFFSLLNRLETDLSLELVCCHCGKCHHCLLPQPLSLGLERTTVVFKP